MRLTGWIVASVAAAFLGCADAPESGYGTIQFAAEGCPEGLALSGSGTCAFSVSVLAGRWQDARPDSVFDSGCVPYSGDLVTIQNFPVGENLTIYMETFDNTECSGATVLEGARGAVNVQEAAEGAKPNLWFVPTFKTGAFSGLPTFPQGLRDAAANTQCTSNEDCRATKEDGNFVLSPVARCVVSTGRCEMPQTAFPLNVNAPRAFHTATTLGDGRIVFVGGVARNQGEGRYLGTDETVEVFDPATMTFARPQIANMSGLRMALHSAAPVGGNRIGVFGGVRQLDMSLEGPAGGERYLQFGFPPKDVTQSDNLVDLAFTVDIDAAKADVGTLVNARLGTAATRVADGVLVTGGAISVGTGVAATNFADLCKMDGTPSCESVGPLVTDRAGHCAVCLDTSDLVCGRIMLLGGLPRTDTTQAVADASIAEIFESGGFTTIGRDNSSDLSGNVVFPTCVSNGSTSYLLGGSVASNKAASIPPAQLALTSGKTKIAAIDLGGSTGVTDPFRIHSRATVLGDGRILVTGGLDNNGRAVKDAYIVDGTSISRQVPMAFQRFGHTATLLTTGPMAGAVLVVGGMTVQGDEILPVVSAELYLP